MADERITQTEGDGQHPHTTTIVHERKSSGAGMMIALVLLIAVIGGLYLFSQSSQSDMVKDNAIAGAANEVGDAASKVGDAAEGVADSVTDQTEK